MTKDMAEEIKNTEQPSAEVNPTAESKEPKSGAKPKTKKTSKEDAPSMLKAVGREACKMHKLEQVWVTDDGQCFPIEGDAKAHAANLKNKELIKVTAE
jgi:hypothetical protein|nr:MAG TPA: hypothetical protein [Caudoviricetes sp.]